MCERAMKWCWRRGRRTKRSAEGSDAPMDIEQALERWSAEQSQYEEFASWVESQLVEIASRVPLAVTVTSRAKDLASYRRKAITKLYEDAWEEVTDKAGARVVVPVWTDVDLFADLLSSQGPFDVIGVEDKREYWSPNELSYSGVHVQIAAIHNGERRECEVQVRTLAQDAWSVVSHKLLYKPDVELPNDEQHAVYRLVALMELFDQEVKRVAEKIPTLPGYEWHTLLDFAEGHYEHLAHSRSARELSVVVLDAIGDVVPRTDEYRDQLGSFIDQNRSHISDALRDYGPKSAVASTYDYALIAQAEFLILLELLESDPYHLQRAWGSSSLPNKWLEAVAMFSDADMSQL
jgi:ppGpp synthetase/RelA/SpoT-type nucleotidyltranferase